MPSYINGSIDFINKISHIKAPAGSFLVTIDVTSLYTNIQHVEALKTVKRLLESKRQGYIKPTNMEIVRLLAIVLRCNNFEFNKKNYLQISVVAMGTNVAPNIANLYMADLEEKSVYTYPKQPFFYGRFIDDGIMICQLGLMELMKFLHYLNNVNPFIKFTWNISACELPFLDILIKIDLLGNITTCLYTKDTDTHLYLQYMSSHPKHVIDSILYSQLIRFRRICSNFDDFLNHALIIWGHFEERGYPH